MPRKRRQSTGLTLAEAKEQAAKRQAELKRQALARIGGAAAPLPSSDAAARPKPRPVSRRKSTPAPARRTSRSRPRKPSPKAAAAAAPPPAAPSDDDDADMSDGASSASSAASSSSDESMPTPVRDPTPPRKRRGKRSRASVETEDEAKGVEGQARSASKTRARAAGKRARVTARSVSRRASTPARNSAPRSWVTGSGASSGTADASMSSAAGTNDDGDRSSSDDESEPEPRREAAQRRARRRSSTSARTPVSRASTGSGRSSTSSLAPDGTPAYKDPINRRPSVTPEPAREDDYQPKPRRRRRSSKVPVPQPDSDGDEDDGQDQRGVALSESDDEDEPVSSVARHSPLRRRPTAGGDVDAPAKRARCDGMTVLVGAGVISALFLAYVVFREPQCCVGCPLWPVNGTVTAAAKRGCVMAVGDHLVAVAQLAAALLAILSAVLFLVWLSWRRCQRRLQRAKDDEALIESMRAFARDSVAFLPDHMRLGGVAADHVRDTFADDELDGDRDTALRLWPKALAQLRTDSRIQVQERVSHGRQRMFIVWISTQPPSKPRFRQFLQRGAPSVESTGNPPTAPDAATGNPRVVGKAVVMH